MSSRLISIYHSGINQNHHKWIYSEYLKSASTSSLFFHRPHIPLDESPLLGLKPPVYDIKFSVLADLSWLSCLFKCVHMVVSFIIIMDCSSSPRWWRRKVDWVEHRRSISSSTCSTRCGFRKLIEAEDSRHKWFGQLKRAHGESMASFFLFIILI